MERVELRPLSLGELLDRTFALYRNHFWLFVGIMAIPSSFSIPMNAFMLTMQAKPAPAGKLISPGFIVGMIAGYLVFFLVFLMVYAVATGAATSAVSEAYLGREATVRGSYGKVRGNFWRIVGVVASIWLRVFGVLFIVFVVGGIMMAIAIVPGRSRPGPALGAILAIGLILVYLAALILCFIFMLRYAVAIPALVLEGLGVTAAIRRSVQLTRGRRAQIFVACLLTVVIAYIGVVVFQGPFFVAMLLTAKNPQAMPWLTFLMSVSGAIGGSLTGPMLMIVLVLCYYDSRIRKEAFDLQYMMSSLERPSPAPGTVSPV